MDKWIIGLVGPIVSGKDTAARYIAQTFDADSFAFADPLRTLLESFAITRTRENIQKVSTQLRELFGQDILARAISYRINQSAKEIIVINGIRRMEDIEEYLGKPNFTLIAITADPEVRYTRLTQRHQNTDDTTVSFETFLQQEQAESDKHIQEMMQHAQVTIENNGDQANFETTLANFITNTINNNGNQN